MALSPALSCSATASRMHSSSIARNSAGVSFCSCAFARASCKLAGRSRLPTWSALNMLLVQLGRNFLERALYQISRLLVIQARGEQPFGRGNGAVGRERAHLGHGLRFGLRNLLL